MLLLQEVNGKHLLKAEPLNAILDPQYFVRQVHECVVRVLNDRLVRGQQDVNQAASYRQDILSQCDAAVACYKTARFAPTLTGRAQQPAAYCLLSLAHACTFVQNRQESTTLTSELWRPCAATPCSVLAGVSRGSCMASSPMHNLLLQELSASLLQLPTPQRGRGFSGVLSARDWLVQSEPGEPCKEPRRCHAGQHCDNEALAPHSQPGASISRT